MPVVRTTSYSLMRRGCAPPDIRALAGFAPIWRHHHLEGAAMENRPGDITSELVSAASGDSREAWEREPSARSGL